MPDGLKAKFNAQPDLLLKYDREGFNTLDSWLTNTAMRKAFAATTGSTGRRMLIAYCTKSESRKPGTESIIKGTPRCTKETKGERSDLNRARELIAIKRTWTEVINDASLSDVLVRHPRWAHDVFENRTAKPVDEAKSLEAFAPWQHQVLAQIGGESGHAVTPGDKVLSWKLPLLSCDRAGGCVGSCPN